MSQQPADGATPIAGTAGPSAKTSALAGSSSGGRSELEEGELTPPSLLAIEDVGEQEKLRDAQSSREPPRGTQNQESKSAASGSGEPSAPSTPSRPRISIQLTSTKPSLTKSPVKSPGLRSTAPFDFLLPIDSPAIALKPRTILPTTPSKPAVHDQANAPPKGPKGWVDPNRPKEDWDRADWERKRVKEDQREKEKKERDRKEQERKERFRRAEEEIGRAEKEMGNRGGEGDVQGRRPLSHEDRIPDNGYAQKRQRTSATGPDKIQQPARPSEDEHRSGSSQASRPRTNRSPRARSQTPFDRLVDPEDSPTPSSSTLRIPMSTMDQIIDLAQVAYRHHRGDPPMRPTPHAAPTEPLTTYINTAFEPPSTVAPSSKVKVDSLHRQWQTVSPLLADLVIPPTDARFAARAKDQAATRRALGEIERDLDAGSSSGRRSTSAFLPGLADEAGEGDWRASLREEEHRLARLEAEATKASSVDDSVPSRILSHISALLHPPKPSSLSQTPPTSDETNKLASNTQAMLRYLDEHVVQAEQYWVRIQEELDSHTA